MSPYRSTALWLASFCVVAACLSTFAGEPEPVTPQSTFRFLGGEHIRVSVTPETGVPFEQIVSEDGDISLPTGGPPLNIKGKTMREAQRLAAERVQNDSTGKRTATSIALLSVPIRSIYVGGDGIKTGISIPLGNGTPLTLYAAILAAGGPTNDGDLTRVTLTRTLPDGHISTDLFDASKFGDKDAKSLGAVLEPGDVIKVPHSESIVLAGEVIKPGPLSLRELFATTHSLRASRAIYLSGGLKPTANRKQISVIRTLPTGEKKFLKVDLDAAEKASPEANSPGLVTGSATDADPALKDGDVILVGQGGGISVLGKVRQAGVFPMNGPSVKLTRIISMAGGFADFAKTSDVVIIKANGSSQHINMGSPQKNGLPDVELEDGDVVFVGERLL